jgi:hypothetical protein
MIMDLNCPACHRPPTKYKETDDGILLMCEKGHIYVPHFRSKAQEMECRFKIAGLALIGFGLLNGN